MKPVLTKTEIDIRSQLEKSARELLTNPNKKRLVQAIEGLGLKVNSGCVLNWIPDQGEDFYLVLVNGDELFHVEINRIDMSESPVVTRTEMKEYLNGLKTQDQIQLKIAKEICADIEAGRLKIDKRSSN